MNWQTKHKFGIVTPIWGRGRLTELWVNHYTEVKPSNSRWVMIESPGDPDPTRVLRDDIVLSVANDPLGDKHNAGSQALKELDVDAMLLIPSDDFFTKEYFEFMDQCLENGYDACKIEALYFYCAQTRRMMYARQLGTGAGTMMSREVLEKVDWKIIPDGVRKSMDANMFGRCKRHFENCRIVSDLRDEKFVGVDVKTDTAIKSFDYLWECWSRPTWRHAECSVNPEKSTSFWQSKFPHIADQITKFNQVGA